MAFRALVAPGGGMLRDLRVSDGCAERDLELFVKVGVAQSQVKICPIALMMLQFIVVILLRCQALFA